MTERLLGQDALADLADIPARSRWVRSAGLRLHVLDYAGHGTPLIMLPGITSPAITMDFVARELTDLVRPIVVDLRGRGLSDSAAGYALTDYAADAAAVIAGLELPPPLVLGHSLGARIAATLAAQGDVPLQGGIFVDPPLSGPGRGTYPTPLAAFRDQLTQARRGTDAAEVAQSWPRWPLRERELRARWLASCDATAIDATHRGFETEDFFTAWPQVPAPAVFVHGGESPVVTEEGAKEASRANPQAGLEQVPGAGHMVFWDAPRPALEILRGALRALTTTQ